MEYAYNNFLKTDPVKQVVVVVPVRRCSAAREGSMRRSLNQPPLTQQLDGNCLKTEETVTGTLNLLVLKNAMLLYWYFQTFGKNKAIHKGAKTR